MHEEQGLEKDRGVRLVRERRGKGLELEEQISRKNRD